MAQADAFQALSAQEYGPQLLQLFEGDAYKPVCVDSADIEIVRKLGIIAGETRSKSSSDQEGVSWTVNDTLYECGRDGITDRSRLIVVEKRDELGRVAVRFWDSLQKISVMDSDYELPSDFDPKEVFLAGIEVVLKGRDDEG